MSLISSARLAGRSVQRLPRAPVESFLTYSSACFSTEFGVMDSHSGAENAPELARDVAMMSLFLIEYFATGAQTENTQRELLSGHR